VIRIAPRLDRLGSVVVDRLMGARLLETASGIPILMYHSVAEDSEPGVSPYYRLTTTPARFAAHMHWLRRNGYAVVDLDAAFHRSAARATDGKRLAVVTFDDGFLDFKTDAWPVLSELGFTATVFLPTAFIGQARRLFKGRPCLTWSEVRKLHGLGVRFGSHTVTHPKLYDLSWSAIRGELLDSRTALEQELGGPVRTFAYPYAFPQEDGDFAKRFKEELMEAGYAAGVTTAIGRMTPSSDPLRLNRLPVNDCDDETLFAAKMAGAYDWVGRVQFAARQARRWRMRRESREVQHS
jgi:peptidoglycan/xylan/chitin deacetylase (PgdA/CDA1 family)